MLENQFSNDSMSSIYNNNSNSNRLLIHVKVAVWLYFSGYLAMDMERFLFEVCK